MAVYILYLQIKHPLPVRHMAQTHGVENVALYLLIESASAG